jgi:hypothetical protein
MRTFSGGMPSVLAASATVQAIIWLEVQSVSWSPSHAAMVAWGSIIECDSCAVV